MHVYIIGRKITIKKKKEEITKDKKQQKQPN